MHVLRFLLNASRPMTIITTMVALVSGIFSGALVAVIHQAMKNPSHQGVIIAVFIGVAAGKLITGYFSEVMLTLRAQKAVAALRVDLARKLQRVPFKSFEQLGQAKVFTTLTDDVDVLSQALYQLPAFAINIAVCVGAATYLIYLSWQTQFLLTGFVLIGAVIYRIVIRRAYRIYDQARTERDLLNDHFITLTQGIKELKLHRQRRTMYTEQSLQQCTDRLMKLDVKAQTRNMLAHITTHFLLIALIGIVLFVAPHLSSLSPSAVIGYVLVALFLMGPHEWHRHCHTPVQPRACIHRSHSPAEPGNGRKSRRTNPF